MIVAAEKNVYRDDCYHPEYNFSYEFMSNQYNVSKDHIHYIFNGRVIVNWAMFSMPRHPIFLDLMKNVVDMIRKEYIRESVVKLYRYIYR